MPDISQFKPEKQFKGLFVSKSGDGKSTAEASFPKPLHELDTDQRFGGIYGSVQQGIIKGEGISYTTFHALSGWEPVDKEITTLNMQRLAASSSSMNQFPYKTIGLGSLGSLERIVLNYVMTKIDNRKHVGTLKLRAPGDQNAANIAVHQVLDYLFAMPCNFIATAHLVEKWGKPKNLPKEETYKPNEIIGEKLNLNDNLAESVISRFDNVFRFDRQDVGTHIKYTVEFAGDLAKNSYGIKPGIHDITNVSFYEYFMKFVETKQCECLNCKRS